jgi:sigma-B regulation protein RsbU (phosphoserine phosphatase)
MNRALQRSVEPGRFATFQLALVPRRSGDLLACNAGHNPALLVRDGHIDKLALGGLALGILESTAYGDERWPFEAGNVLILYSDGVTECQWKDDLYGEDRLSAIVTEACGKASTAAEIGKAILDDVRSFCRGHTESDDLTLVVVKHK